MQVVKERTIDRESEDQDESRKLSQSQIACPQSRESVGLDSIDVNNETDKSGFKTSEVCQSCIDLRKEQI